MVGEQGRIQSDDSSDVDVATSMVRPPRPWGWGFLLHVCTCGLYTCFWLVSLLREMKRFNQPQVRPWLWVFVPLVTLPQFVALPRLLNFLRDAEQRVGLPPWGGSRYAWIVLVILVSLFFDLQYAIAIPMWSLLPALLVWGALYSVIEHRFNQVRRILHDAPSESEKGSRTPYRWWEWLLLVPSVPFTLILIPYLSFDSMGLYDVESLPQGSAYIHEEAGFQFPILSSGWREVAPGTHSEDDAVLELSGPIDDVFAIVYRYDNQSVSELAYDRKSAFYRNVQAGNCSEVRRFSGWSVDVRSQLICEGREYNLDSLQATGIIRGKDAVYELMVYLNTPAITYRKLKPEVIRMTEEFAPL